MEEIGYSEIIGTLALIIAGIDLALILLDRRPTLKVSAHIDYELLLDEDSGVWEPFGSRIWITIANKSPRRILVESVYAEWRWRPMFFSRRVKAHIPELQGRESISRFWIEPWGNEVLIGDDKELERRIGHNKYGPIWYCIVVEDGLGKAYRSRSWKIKGELKTKPEPEPEKW